MVFQQEEEEDLSPSSFVYKQKLLRIKFMAFHPENLFGRCGCSNIRSSLISLFTHLCFSFRNFLSSLFFTLVIIGLSCLYLSLFRLRQTKWKISRRLLLSLAFALNEFIPSFPSTNVFRWNQGLSWCLTHFRVRCPFSLNTLSEIHSHGHKDLLRRNNKRRTKSRSEAICNA